MVLIVSHSAASPMAKNCVFEPKAWSVSCNHPHMRTLWNSWNIIDNTKNHFESFKKKTLLKTLLKMSRVLEHAYTSLIPSLENICSQSFSLSMWGRMGMNHCIDVKGKIGLFCLFQILVRVQNLKGGSEALILPLSCQFCHLVLL